MGERKALLTGSGVSVVMATVLTATVRLLFFVTGFSFEWIYYLLFFTIVFVVSVVTSKYLHARYVRESLQDIYHQIQELRGTKVVRPAPSDSVPALYAEISRILNDWNKESRSEIDQMKQVETYRRDFLSNVSHELKTPIFSVQGFVHTLIDGGIDDPDINMHYLSKASKGIDRLIHIVEDLESISRLEAGELILDKRTFDILELVSDVFDSLALQAREKLVSFQSSSSTGERLYVYADKDLIRQVLVNLIVNSVKYGVKGGATIVSVSPVGEKVVVEVSDNGIGIEKRHLPRLFERFYRVDKSRSREQGGTGLGLAIVKHILEAHNESISVDSEPGKGTIFVFSLLQSR
jgi:two-component system phosphate regulon sensor histidine kinase PhoR